MALPFLGRNASVGIGAESTPGTRVTVTNFRPPISLEGGRNPEFKRRPNLRTAGTGVNMPVGFYQASEMPAGRFQIEATYENIGMWLKAAFGDLATSGSGPYTHLFTLGELEAYSLEYVRGNASNSEIFGGVKFGKTSFKAAPGGLLLIDVDWMGMNGASRTTPTSVSYGSGDTPIRAFKSGQFTWNSVSYDLDDIEISIDHGLQARPYLGALTSREYAPGEIRVMARGTVEYSADTLYTALVAGTQADGSLAFTDSASLSLTFALQNGYLTKVSEPVQSHGVIKQQWEMELIGDTGGDKGLTASLVNGNSSGTAN